MISLAWWPFLMLLPAPWLLVRWRHLIRSSQAEPAASKGALWIPFYEATQSHTQTRQTADRSTTWLRLLRWLAWICFLLALARPQWVGEPIPLQQEGRDLFLAIDISPSMLEQDMVWRNRQANRLDVVKAVVSEFLQQRQGDRVGLILFGSQPYIQAPLTYDLETAEKLLMEAQAGMAGESTSLGDAIGLAIKRLKDHPEQHRVLLLLTDGRNTSGEVSPTEAARQAARHGVTLYTIGLGSDKLVRRGLFSPTRSASADLDEALLTELAETTGGRYFRARSSSELELVYEAINQLEPISQDNRLYRPTTEYYWQLALLSLVLALIATLLPIARNTLKETP